jgi:hypothetical protein
MHDMHHVKIGYKFLIKILKLLYINDLEKI